MRDDIHFDFSKLKILDLSLVSDEEIADLPTQCGPLDATLIRPPPSEASHPEGFAIRDEREFSIPAHILRALTLEEFEACFEQVTGKETICIDDDGQKF